MIRFLYIVLISLMLFISHSTFSQVEQSEQETQLNIYPNPVMSGQEMMVEMRINDPKVIHVYIYDFAGKLVMESANHRLGFNEDVFQHKISIEDKGLYILKLVLEDEATKAKQAKVKKLYVI